MMDRRDIIRTINLKFVVLCFPLVVLAVLISVRFLDAHIALTVMEILRSYPFFQNSTSNIPDILFLLVCGGSTLLWMNYFYLKRKAIINDLRRFSLLAASALPTAYFLKYLCKLLFGRTNTRVWLFSMVSDKFHWFHGGGNFGGFPSGHMTVFSAFFAAAWIYYPRCRYISVGIMLLLTTALIGTDYHFLSDIIAGAYLGLLTTCLASIGLKRFDT